MLDIPSRQNRTLPRGVRRAPRQGRPHGVQLTELLGSMSSLSRNTPRLGDDEADCDRRPSAAVQRKEGHAVKIQEPALIGEVAFSVKRRLARPDRGSP